MGFSRLWWQTTVGLLNTTNQPRMRSVLTWRPRNPFARKRIAGTPTLKAEDHPCHMVDVQGRLSRTEIEAFGTALDFVRE